MSSFSDAMSESGLPAMTEVVGEDVTHRAPGGPAEGVPLTAPFEELDSAENEQLDRREGLDRIRTAKLTVPSTVTVSLGKAPSCFVVRGELWTAKGISDGPGLQIVRIERREQATQSRSKTQSHQ